MDLKAESAAFEEQRFIEEDMGSSSLCPDLMNFQNARPVEEVKNILPAPVSAQKLSMSNLRETPLIL